jgi:hypothetical protein
MGDRIPGKAWRQGKPNIRASQGQESRESAGTGRLRRTQLRCTTILKWQEPTFYDSSPIAAKRRHESSPIAVNRIWRVLAIVGLGAALALAILNGWYHG